MIDPIQVVFDAEQWGGKDVGDNSQFWHPARIIHHNGTTAQVQFLHNGKISNGHFLDSMRPWSPFHLMQCIGALRIEVNTGMRHSRGSILRMAQGMYGVKSQTKKRALKELEALYKEATGREYGSPA